MSWSDAPQVFDTPKQVGTYLHDRFIQASGAPVAVRTVEGHIAGRSKKGKLLLTRPQGGFALEDVKDYVQRMRYLPKGSDVTVEVPETAASAVSINIQAEQEKEKLRKLKQENERLAYEIGQKKKNFCRVSDLDQEMAARGLALRHFLESHAEEKAAEIMTMERREDVVAIIMDGVDAALHDYVSQDSYHILVRDDGIDD